jgi:uncharacterized membrane protein
MEFAMAKDASDAVRNALGHALRDAVKNIGDVSPQKKAGSFSGAKGLAAGAGLAALAPLAKKGVDKVRSGGVSAVKPSTVAGGLKPTKVVGDVANKAGEGVGNKLKEVADEKIDRAGGVGGLVKEAAGGLLPGIGGDSGGGEGMEGVGKGRRMPVQQAVDVAVPLETAYNQWTQFEDWPEFMHRVTRVTQDDECTVKFATKIWGKTKEFEAKIETQRPDERIKWSVAQGITHHGVVTFHELAPRLTRIELNFDVAPGSLIEKAARGMRHVKRAARADLHRFKAFIEMQESETGAWRGVIEEGELVEPHDDSYDEKRDYSDIEELQFSENGSDEDESEDDEESQEGRTQRFKRQAEAQQRSSRSSASAGGNRRSGNSSKKSQSSGRSRGSSNGRSSRSGSSAKRKTSSRS